MWPVYTIDRQPNLKHKFTGSEQIHKNYSQANQDMFVLMMLDGKRNGTFLEIGAHEPINISNTYLLEKDFDWNGISIDIVEDELWFVGHIVSYEQPRHYYHTIMVFDANMNLLRYSAPFKFEGDCIEYCLSIVVEDEQVLINYSTWDRTTRIAVYDKNYIDSIVKYR